MVRNLFWFLVCNSKIIKIIGHAIGRQAIIGGDIIQALAKLFDDKEPIARRNAHNTIEMLCEFPLGLKKIKFIYEH